MRKLRHTVIQWLTQGRTNPESQGPMFLCVTNHHTCLKSEEALVMLTESAAQEKESDNDMMGNWIWIQSLGGRTVLRDEELCYWVAKVSVKKVDMKIFI